MNHQEKVASAKTLALLGGGLGGFLGSRSEEDAGRNALILGLMGAGGGAGASLLGRLGLKGGAKGGDALADLIGKSKNTSALAEGSQLLAQGGGRALGLAGGAGAGLTGGGIGGGLLGAILDEATKPKEQDLLEELIEGKEPNELSDSSDRATKLLMRKGVEPTVQAAQKNLT